MGHGLLYIKKIVYYVQLEPWRKGKRPVQALYDDICFMFLEKAPPGSSWGGRKSPFITVPGTSRMEDEQEHQTKEIQKRQCSVISGQSLPIRIWDQAGMGLRRSFVGRKYYPNSMHSEQQVTTIARS